MLQGNLGQPEGGWPPPLQKVRYWKPRASQPFTERPGSEDWPKSDFAENERRRTEPPRSAAPPRDVDVLSYLMYPQVFLDYEKFVKQYDNTSVIPTPAFLYGMQSGDEINVEIEPGKTLIIRYLTTGESRPDGLLTVFFELNGQPREVNVPDRSAEATVHRNPKADPDDPAQVAAPMPGKISSVMVTKGTTVKAGDRLLSIEAMKMETAVYSPRDGTVKDVLVKPNSVVTAKDLLVVLE